MRNSGTINTPVFNSIHQGRIYCQKGVSVPELPVVKRFSKGNGHTLPQEDTVEMTKVILGFVAVFATTFYILSLVF